MRKTVLAALMAAALTAAACGGGSSVKESDDPAAKAPAEAAAPNAKTVPIGKTLATSKDGINVDWTVTTARTAAADQYGSEPATNGKWVLVHARAAVKPGRDAYICGCDLSIIAKSGRVYQPSFASFKGKRDLPNVNVGPGQNADGWVIFDVAGEDLNGARIQLKQLSLLDDAASGYWTLTITK